jgi:uncharacterized membrane protein YoaK (UPF0700 family)
LLGGALITRYGGHRGRLLRNAVAVELLLFLGAMLVVAAGPEHLGNVRQGVTAAAAALALGVQNAVVRRLAVPDLTTTVLTMTLTGIAADFRSGNRVTSARRLLAVAAMLLGGAAGALLVLHVGIEAGLGVATLLVAVVLAGSAAASRSRGSWSTLS